MTERPVTWCDDPSSTLTLLGDYNWSDLNVTVQVKAEETSGVFVALRVNQGGSGWYMSKVMLMLLAQRG